MDIVLIAILVLSFCINLVQFGRLKYLSYHPHTEIKEIEVVRKAMCECGHVSSYHDDKGCRQHVFVIDGTELNKSVECYCKRYVGPLPIQEIFDEKMREIENARESA